MTGPATPAVDVQGLDRVFDIFPSDQARARHALWSAAAHLPGLGRRARRRRDAIGTRTWALRDVSFAVGRGESVGVIGANGSGKSTLLHVLCGTLAPSAGTVRTSGRIGALLELGTGFVADLTGRENVRLSGLLHGLDEAAVASREADIAAFADIGAYLDQPVRTYSSGMYVRLAFAVMAHVDADVMIVDEALAVGDIRFVQKCLAHLERFRANGGTLLFVSHDLPAVQRLCQRVIWLDRGQLRMDGPPRDVTEAYFDSMIGVRSAAIRSRESGVGSRESEVGRREAGGGNRESGVREREPGVGRREAGSGNRESGVRGREAGPSTGDGTPDAASGTRDWGVTSAETEDIPRAETQRARPGAAPAGTAARPHDEAAGRARIADVRLVDETGGLVAFVRGGERVTLLVEAGGVGGLRQPVVGFYVKDRLGQQLFGENTLAAATPAPRPGDRLIARFRFVMPRLFPGDYLVAVAIADGTQADHVHHEWRHDAWHFTSAWPGGATGLVGIDVDASWLSPDGAAGG